MIFRDRFLRIDKLIKNAAHCRPDRHTQSRSGASREDVGVRVVSTHARYMAVLTVVCKTWTEREPAHVHMEPLDPDVHTQNVESMWARSKRKLKYQYGTSRNLSQSYLAEFTWRSWHRGEAGVFEQFTECIREIYAI